jgi:DNA-binding helix-hairpin-helix protein with protein kinase domain
VKRSANHDNFGLALLIFHLLFMGRHPFSGRYGGAGDMPIEKAIAEGRFAFSSRAASFQMAPPPHALALDFLTPPISSLFERAFALPKVGTPRPTAAEWRINLAQLKASLVRCQIDKAHAFPKHLSACPWCRIEENGGPAFFVASTVTVEFDPTFDLFKIWNEITRINVPPDVTAINVKSYHGNFIASPIPIEARPDLVGPCIDAGPPPSLIQERLPTVEPYRTLLETIPSDPPYSSLPTPILPPLILPPAPTAPILPDPKTISLPGDRQAEREYWLFAWLAIASCIAEVAIVFVQPILSTFVSPLPLAFVAAWVWFYRKRVHIREERRQDEQIIADANKSTYQKQLAMHNVKMATWEKLRATGTEEWSRKCADIHRQWELAESKNKRAWEAQIVNLASQREEAPHKEAQHRKEWEEESERIQTLQIEVEARNHWQKAQWTIALEQHSIRTQKAAETSQQIAQARSRLVTERNLRQRRKDEITAQLEALRTTWVPESLRLQNEWRKLHESLQSAKGQYETLWGQFKSDLSQRQANQRDLQLKDFLDKILIVDEPIPNFGKNRKTLLAANGIETALDITDFNLQQLSGQGLGEKLGDQLLDWRRDQERKFRFDPNKGMPLTELRALHAKYQGQRVMLQRALRGGCDQAEAIRLLAVKRLNELQRQANEVLVSLGQVQADLAICDRILS